MFELTSASLTSTELLDSLVAKRRLLKELAQGCDANRREEVEKVVDDILKLSFDGVPLTHWPPSPTNAFVRDLGTLATSALSGISSVAKVDLERLGAVHTIANLLLGLSAAVPSVIDHDVKLEISRLWVSAHLAQGVSALDLQAFVASAVNMLKRTQANEQDLTSLVQTLTLAYATNRLALAGQTADTTSAVGAEPSPPAYLDTAATSRNDTPTADADLPVGLAFTPDMAATHTIDVDVSAADEQETVQNVESQSSQPTQPSNLPAMAPTKEPLHKSFECCGKRLLS